MRLPLEIRWEIYLYAAVPDVVWILPTESLRLCHLPTHQDERYIPRIEPSLLATSKTIRSEVRALQKEQAYKTRFPPPLNQHLLSQKSKFYGSLAPKALSDFSTLNAELNRSLTSKAFTPFQRTIFVLDCDFKRLEEFLKPLKEACQQPIRRILITDTCWERIREPLNALLEDLDLDEIILRLPYGYTDRGRFCKFAKQFAELLWEGRLKKLSFTSSEAFGSMRSTVEIDHIRTINLRTADEAEFDAYLSTMPWSTYDFPGGSENSRRKQRSKELNRLLAYLPQKFIETREDDQSRCEYFHGLKWARSMMSLTRNDEYDVDERDIHALVAFAFDGKWSRAFDVLRRILKEDPAKMEKLEAEAERRRFSLRNVLTNAYE